MSQVRAVLLLVAISAVWLVPVLGYCSYFEPTNCNFYDYDTCGWILDDGWNAERRCSGWNCYYYYYYYFLEFNGKSIGRIKSGTACSTQGSTECLKFRYRFERDDVVDLNVIINGSQTGETVVWSMSSSNGWDDATVPIKTDQNFTVIIEAKTRNRLNSNCYVRFYNVEYYVFESCYIQPSEAQPTTTTSTTTTFATKTTTTTSTTSTTTHVASTTTTSATKTEPTMTPSSERGGASGQTTATRKAHMEPTSPATTPATADQAASSQSQDDVVTIVGAVAGVVVVAVVVVVLLLVFRKKQLSFWKTCFKADKQRGEHFDVTASHNAAYNLDLGDQGETSDMKLTATDTVHYSPPLEATAPSHSSDDYYNIINTPHKKPPNQMYAAVNKPRRPNPATANPTHQKATPLPSDQMYAAVTKAHRSHPGPQPSVTDPAEDSPYEIASDTPDCTAHQPAGDAAAGLYHCLEDDPETQPQLDTTDPYLAPDTLDTDTYTLDTDTYTLDTDTYTLDTDTYTLDTDTYTLAQHLYDVPPGARPTPPSVTHPVQKSHQHSVTSHSEDGDYNSLDLDGRRRVVERGEGEGPSQVYSGLNEGDGDTYSEVNHHSRKEVIDDQYSRFQ